MRVVTHCTLDASPCCQSRRARGGLDEDETQETLLDLTATRERINPSHQIAVTDREGRELLIRRTIRHPSQKVEALKSTT